MSPAIRQYRREMRQLRSFGTNAAAAPRGTPAAKIYALRQHCHDAFLPSPLAQYGELWALRVMSRTRRRALVAYRAGRLP